MKKQVRNKTLRCAVLEKSSTTVQSGGTQSYCFTLTPIISLEPHQAPKLCQLLDIYASLIISRTSGFCTFSMRTFKITATYPVDRSAFLLSVRAPQHEDQALQVSAQPLHHSVCERLPSFVFVRVGLVCSHSQHSVQQQDACKVTNGFKLLRSFWDTRM